MLSRSGLKNEDARYVTWRKYVKLIEMTRRWGGASQGVWIKIKTPMAEHPLMVIKTALVGYKLGEVQLSSQSRPWLNALILYKYRHQWLSIHWLNKKTALRVPPMALSLIHVKLWGVFLSAQENSMFQVPANSSSTSLVKQAATSGWRQTSQWGRLK